MIRSLFKEKTNSTAIQLLRYTFVGGIAFFVDFGSLYAFTEFMHIHYLASAALAFCFGLLTNYFLSIFWVFDKRKTEKKYLEFMIFGLIGIIGLGLNELIIWIFTEQIHFHYLLSKVASTFFVYLWNFFARKYTLFK